jgi:hypothetical protein
MSSLVPALAGPAANNTAQSARNPVLIPILSEVMMSTTSNPNTSAAYMARKDGEKTILQAILSKRKARRRSGAP